MIWWYRVAVYNKGPMATESMVVRPSTTGLGRSSLFPGSASSRFEIHLSYMLARRTWFDLRQESRFLRLTHILNKVDKPLQRCEDEDNEFFQWAQLPAETGWWRTWIWWRTPDQHAFFCRGCTQPCRTSASLKKNWGDETVCPFGVLVVLIWRLLCTPKTSRCIFFEHCYLNNDPYQGSWSAMAELAALSLAGNIVQFVDFGIKLFSEARDLYESAQDGRTEDLELESVTLDLKSFAQSLHSNAKPGSQPKKPSADDIALMKLAVSCEKLANELLKLLDDLKVKGQQNRRWKSFRQALRHVKKAEKINKLEVRLEKLRKQITTHLIGILRFVFQFKLPCCTASG